MMWDAIDAWPWWSDLVLLSVAVVIVLTVADHLRTRHW